MKRIFAPILIVSAAATTATATTGAFGSLASRTMSSMASSSTSDSVDSEYPGTAVKRLEAVHQRVASLTEADLSQEWEGVRQKLLWAGGLKDLKNARPGEGYTGHSFNDFNHCDLTTMLLDVADNEHDGTAIPGIAKGNALGNGIRKASIPLGEKNSGSWSTCMIGSAEEPPRDVAHVQFRSRIAFKLVWCPDDSGRFTLVDDSGALLAFGKPTGNLPHLMERRQNYLVVRGSKFAKEADKLCGNQQQQQQQQQKEL